MLRDSIELQNVFVIEQDIRLCTIMYLSLGCALDVDVSWAGRSRGCIRSSRSCGISGLGVRQNTALTCDCVTEMYAWENVRSKALFPHLFNRDWQDRKIFLYE